MKKYELTDIGDDARRQYIDAQGAFTAWEEALSRAAEVRGGMIWRTQAGKEYLVRTSPTSTQKSLGPKSEETVRIYENFMRRKTAAEERVATLKKTLERHQKMNRALNVGHTPQVIVDILQRLYKAGVSEYFTVVGTNALYAYQSAAGVRFEAKALATKDVDLLWDVRRRVAFVGRMKMLDTSLLGLLRKVDRTFELRDGDRCTAVNSDGYEVDVICRKVAEDDPHPARLTDHDDEFLAVQATTAERLLAAPRFSQMVVSSSGHMARMNTIHPLYFAAVKRWLAELPERDPLKRQRDLLQAELVEELVEEYLPHLQGAP